LDLTKSPIDADIIPPVEKDFGGTRMPQAYWEDEHRRLGRTLFMMLNANKVLASSNARQDALSMHTILGDGLAVLQDILILHHPRHQLTLAPRYDDVRLTAPVMEAKTNDGELLVASNKYISAYNIWETHLLLYYELRLLRTSDFLIMFKGGFGSRGKCFVTLEHTDVLPYQQAHRAAYPEPPMPRKLLVDALADHIQVCLQQGSSSRVALHHSTMTNNIMAIWDDPSSSSYSTSIAPLSSSARLPDNLTTWCLSVGDAELSNQLIAASTQFKGRSGPSGQFNNHKNGNHFGNNSHYGRDGGNNGFRGTKNGSTPLVNVHTRLVAGYVS
jgi:hypothetical protein